MERDNSLLDDYVLGLTEAARPRVCFLPTASGDADHYVVRFYRRFSPTCEASHVSLFRRDQGTGGVEDDFETHLLAQDVIYVGGGNVVSMLGAWRAHGLDEILCRAWRKGVVLCGPSAGSLCWFDEALSAFHGAPRSVRGLGLLPYSNCVHYDDEPARRAEYHRFVGEGMCPGFAVDDGVALHFRRTRLKRVVSSRPGGGAYRVEPCGDGAVVEQRLEVSFLGASETEAPIAARTQVQPVADPAPVQPVDRPAQGGGSHMPATRRRGSRKPTARMPAARMSTARMPAARMPNARASDSRVPAATVPVARLPVARKARRAIAPEPLPA